MWHISSTVISDAGRVVSVVVVVSSTIVVVVEEEVVASVVVVVSSLSLVHAASTEATVRTRRRISGAGLLMALTLADGCAETGTLRS